MKEKVIVMIPTYNEKENIGKLINKILNLNIKNLEISVVDDFSPDGTWKIVENISKNNKKVHLIVRKKNRGRGLAGIDGFKYCLEHNADYIIEMDGDLSHNPVYIPNMLKEIKKYDVILGSRCITGGKDTRNIIRRIITFLANLYIRRILKLNVKDCNSGYRCFKRGVLEGININNMISTGPSIVQEVLYKAHLKKFRIKEIPIAFNDRKLGKSKLGLKRLIVGYWMILKLKMLYLLGNL